MVSPPFPVDFCYALRALTLGGSRAPYRRAIDKEANVVRRIGCFFGLIACLVIGHQVLAQQFSADVSSQRQSNTGVNKLYSSDNKVRLEVQTGNQMGPSALILDEAQHKYVML